MDLATILGLLVGFGLVGAAVVLGGSPTAFIDLPAILIVVGGTFGVTTMSFSIIEVIKSQGLIFKTFFSRDRNPGAAALLVMELADRARREGVLTMQKLIGEFASEPFLQKSLGLVIDGVPGDDIERILQREVNAMTERHTKGASILRRAAEVSPAMGLIGTLVGLVQMLGRLDDPSTIGPSMAVALLTTFYGAILANMVFSPMAAKLERNSKEESMVNTVFLTAAASMGRQENPRRLEMLLNTILPPAHRLQYYED